MLEDIRKLQAELADLAGLLKKTKTTQVSQKPTIETARHLVDTYFRNCRPLLVSGQINSDSVSIIDGLMQSLLESTHKRTILTIFKSTSEKARKALIEVEKLALLDTGAANITVNI